MKKKDAQIFAKTNPVTSKAKAHQQQAKKQQKQISQMFKNLTLQKKPKPKQKEEPMDMKLMKEYSFINSSSNIIVFNDQQDDDLFQKQHQNYLFCQEQLPIIIDKFKKEQKVDIEQIQIIYENDSQDIQNLSKFNELLEILVFLLGNPSNLNRQFVKKTYGLLMNGIEGFIFYDETGDDILKDILKLEWSEEFTIRYMLVFLKRQTKRFYFVANSKKPIIFDYYIKCFCLLNQFQPTIIEISNNLFKYPVFRTFVNQKQSLIESLNQEQKLFIQSIMANYADVNIDREKLINKLKNTNISDTYITQTKNNINRMATNAILIEKKLIEKNFIEKDLEKKFQDIQQINLKK